MRKVLLLLSLCLSFTATAQDFKILFLNTETIKIGGKDLKKGDVFNESDKIVWKDDKQAMKVLSLSDYKQFVITAPGFKQNKVQNLKDYMVRSNRLSTRGSGSLSSVERQIGETLYVIDTTEVSISFEPNESEFFFLLKDGDRHILEYKEGRLLFTPDIWDGRQDMITVNLFFHHSDNEEEIVIEDLIIVPIPEAIQLKKSRRR